MDTMNYNELYEKYQKLLAENGALRAENEEYSKRLGLTVPAIHQQKAVGTDVKHSSHRDKQRRKGYS
jgi:regulator of replication initiation timing